MTDEKIKMIVRLNSKLFLKTCYNFKIFYDLVEISLNGSSFKLKSSSETSKHTRILNAINVINVTANENYFRGIYEILGIINEFKINKCDLVDSFDILILENNYIRFEPAVVPKK